MDGQSAEMRLILCLALTLAAPVSAPRVAASLPGRDASGQRTVAPAAATTFRGEAVLRGPVGGEAGFRWPVDGARVVRPFDPPARPWLAGHRGVDVAARSGAVVHAAGPGIVVYAGRIAGRGVVSIRHAGDLRTTYEPVDVDGRLRPGDPVATGTPLGVLAGGHCRTDACLHWGLRRGEQYLDPLSLLGLGRVRLLPL